MKEGKTLVELAQELTRQAQVKQDYIVKGSAAELVHEDDSFGLKVDGIDTFGISKHTHGQLATRMEIPKKYYDKMRHQSPELLLDNVNHWLGDAADKKYLVRTLDSNARALLSNRYRSLDNNDLAEVALPALCDAGCEIVSCEITEERFYLKAVTPKLQYDLKQNDPVQAGIVISNSEIGAGSFSVEAMLYRLVCTNGMIAPEAKFKQSHLGKAIGSINSHAELYLKDDTRKTMDQAFWKQIRDMIQYFFAQDNFESIVERFRASQAETIQVRPTEAVEVLSKNYSLRDSESDSVLMHLMQGGDMNKFGIVNAITRTAQDVDSYDRATSLERLGGEVLELPRNQWEAIAA